MLSLADRLTVPQFFFNENHIGGADETVAIIEKWDKDANGRSSKEVYEEEIASKPDPTDKRLAVPTEPPVKEPVAPPRPDMEYAVNLAGAVEITVDDNNRIKADSVLNVTKKLIEALPHKNLTYLLTTYKDCFRGSDGMSAIQEAFNLPTREAAVKFGKYLQKEHKIIHHACDDHEFSDTSDLFFRLQPFHTPDVLNSFRIWSERVDTDNPLGVVKRCKKLFGKVESAHTDTNGDFNYKEAKEDPNFYEFEEAVCELQGLDLASMEDSTKLAFCINVYNLMIKHAFVKVGVPSSTLARGTFFSGVKYNIGGQLFSFSELENGIIRANSKAPYSLFKPFSKSDPRLKLIYPNADPRIHFALNCGAKSCPPVKNFSAQALDEELRVVAQAFCEQETSVKVDENAMELHLSMILNWYRPDFADSEFKLADKVVTFLRGEKKAALERMLEQQNSAISISKSISIKWIPYDWNTNASEKVDFESSTLSPHQSALASYLPTA
jgi:hypothetical protein